MSNKAKGSKSKKWSDCYQYIDLEIITKFAIESELTAQGQSEILNEDYQVEEMLNER